MPEYSLPWIRIAAAAALSLLVSLGGGAVVIPVLRRRLIAPGHSASPTLNALHRHKQSTPTMGGLFVLLGLATALVLCVDLYQPHAQVALGLCLGLGALGALDDLTKLRGTRRGLSARRKLAGQLLLATAAVVWLRPAGQGIAANGADHLGGIDLIQLAAVLWIVGASNAVNLTDGLDGLAAGCLLWATAAVGLIVFVDLPGAPTLGSAATAANRAELLILAAALFGSVLGFLRYNRRPARVFLGDTGSLPLGGLLGLLAIGSGNRLACTIVGGVFVAELASVALQVAWFKCSGHRLLRCAPLHHHFQFLGWTEGKIVGRFWAAAAICAVLGVAVGMRHSAAQPRSVVAASPAIAAADDR